MYKAKVVSPQIGDGTMDNPMRPQLGDDYQLSKWEDGGDHLMIECEAAVLDAIKADPVYDVLSEELIEDAAAR